MEVLCPNRGYHLVSVDASTLIGDPVKTEQTTVTGPPYEGFEYRLVRTPDGSSVNTSEAGDVQQSGGDALTTAEKIEVQELYQAGYALARIRQMIGKPKVSLAQIEAATKLDKSRK